MTTCGDLITECEAQLHGWGVTQDRVTPLTANIGATDMSFTVDFAFGQAVGIAPGVVQIDSELIYIVNIDANTNIATVAPGFGRGYKGSTAVAHTAGAPVITRPKFPRIWLFKQINEIIASVFPDLFAVGTFTGTVTYPVNRYNLGSTIGVPQRIIDAEWQDPIGNWRKCPSFSLDPFDGTFVLGDGAMPGRPLRVIYACEPQPFTDETSTLADIGLSESCRDVLTLGVVAKQVPGLDISRAQLSATQQPDQARAVPANAGVNAAKYLMAEFQDRLSNEAASLRKRYKTRIVRI